MTIPEINAKLIDYFGIDMYGYPRFRISWSDSQIEKRFGTFEEFSGPIYLRTVTGVREVKKYPYINERWVLEVAAPNAYNDVEKRYGYEPIWTFEDSKGEPVFPVWRAILIIIKFYLNPRKMTPGQVAAEEAAALEKEAAFFENYLAGDMTGVGSLLSNREAVFIPSKEN